MKTSRKPIRQRLALGVAAISMLTFAAAAPAQSFLEQLEKQLENIRPGAGGEPAPPAAPPILGLTADNSTEGVKVLSVRAGGPADQSGVKPGDILTGLGGKQVTTLADLAAAVKTTTPGRPVEILLNRQGLKVSTRLTPVARPPEIEEPATPFARPIDPAPIAPAPFRDTTPARPALGVTVVDLTDALRVRYGVVVRTGALVTNVQPGSAAQRAGVPVGAVVVAVDGRRVDTADDLIAAVQASRVGQPLQVTWYEGNRLVRRAVILEAARGEAGGGLAERLGAGGSRPLLGALGRALDDAIGDAPRAGGGPAPRIVDSPASAVEVELLQQRVRSLETTVLDLQRRMLDLETRLKAATTGGDGELPPLDPPAKPGDAKNVLPAPKPAGEPAPRKAAPKDPPDSGEDAPPAPQPRPGEEQEGRG
ncbi:MAG: PDZ domain-containing protein [Pirellulaceae bacterium]|jgi:hypothetical protein|nr:PDZ domain-containing protein [Pirellulaceae bacterium]MDP7019680.1 PDZ domain-containing protein [Pirellulaceae bacterium]